MAADGDGGPGEVQASVFREVPDMLVEVLPGQHVVHGEKDYYGDDYPVEHGKDAGKEIRVDGPTAFALVMGGHVKIVGQA